MLSHVFGHELRGSTLATRDFMYLQVVSGSPDRVSLDRSHNHRVNFHLYGHCIHWPLYSNFTLMQQFEVIARLQNSQPHSEDAYPFCLHVRHLHSMASGPVGRHYIVGPFAVYFGSLSHAYVAHVGL